MPPEPAASGADDAPALARLSEARLWNLQRDFYEEHGPRAWSEGRVPSHLTSNAYIARAYARLIQRYWLDCRAQDIGDPEAPLELLELGSGSGAFAYLLLKALFPMLEMFPEPRPRLRLILSDVAAANVEALRRHRAFRALASVGLIEVVSFDAETGSFTLGGDEPWQPKNPPVVIANYVFDSLRQDVFRIAGGKLAEGLCAPDPAKIAEAVPVDEKQSIVELDVTWRNLDGPAYEDPLWQELVIDYGRRLGDTVLNFPVGALRCLANLERMCGERFLVLTADKGQTCEHQLIGNPRVGVVWHQGCFSMGVNFHALARWTTARGGFALGTTDDGQLEVAALCMGGRPPQFPSLRLEFEDLKRLSPVQIFRVMTAAGKSLDNFELEDLLGLLGLAAYDAYTFHSLSERLFALAGPAPTAGQRRLCAALKKVQDHFFPLSGSRDVFFDLGRMYTSMRRFNEALELFQLSLEVFGEHPVTLYNLGLNLYREGRRRAALAALERCLELSPDYGKARTWRLVIENELDGSGLLARVPKEEGSGG